MRAREPDRAGYVERDGVRVHYETFGAEGPWVVFPPADVLVNSAMWKAQVPYLARRHRVVVIDPRGNGRSDKPTDPAAYSDREFDADLMAVMDELGVDRAVLVGLCMSAYYSLAAAAWHPDRVAGVVTIATWAAEGTPRWDRGGDYAAAVERWDGPYTGGSGWWTYNRELWLRDWPRWPEFWFSEMVNDPHSTKLREDLVGWACESTGPAQVAAQLTTCCRGDAGGGGCPLRGHPVSGPGDPRHPRLLPAVRSRRPRRADDRRGAAGAGRRRTHSGGT